MSNGDLQLGYTVAYFTEAYVTTSVILSVFQGFNTFTMC